MTLTNDQVRSIKWGGNDENTDGLTVISDTPFDHRRWAVWYRMVFLNEGDGKFYRADYAVPATESQEVDDDREIDCVEVFPVDLTVIAYETAEEISSANRLAAAA